MRSWKRSFLSLLMFLMAFGAIGTTVFPVTPAIAQTTPAPPAGGDSGGFSGFLQSIYSSFTATPKTFAVEKQKALVTVQAIGCWGCDIFSAFSAMTFTTGANLSGTADGALRPLIAAFGSVFALFYLGSAFISGDASELAQKWKVFWRLCIAVAVGSAWLHAGSFTTTWNVVYGPLLRIPLAVEQSVGDSSQECGGGSAPNAPSGAGPVIDEMAKVVCGANKITMDGIATGIAVSNTGDGWLGWLTNAIAGIALILIFAWLAVTFPLRFIDVLLRLAVVGIITPILVVCAVFRPTRSYVQLGISNVLNAGALFMFTGIMFKLGSTFFTQIINKSMANVGSNDTGTVIANSVVMVGAGVVFAAMTKMAPALASEFSRFGGSSGGVGDAVGGFSQTVVMMPVKAGGSVVGAAGQSVMTGRAVAGAMGGAGGGGGSTVASALGKTVTK